MSGRQIYSLRRRLVGLLIAVVALLWSLSAAVAFRTAHGEADELFDAQMVQVAETLLAIVAAGGPGQVAHEMAEHQHDYQLPVAFQAWQRDETGSGWHLLVRSAEMTDVPATREAGFDEHEQQGALWRFYTVDHDHGRYRVIVGQQHATRYRLAGEIALHLLLPILIGLPLIAIGIWVVVGRALRPVDAVAGALGGRVPAAAARVSSLALLAVREQRSGGRHQGGRWIWTGSTGLWQTCACWQGINLQCAGASVRRSEPPRAAGARRRRGQDHLGATRCRLSPGRCPHLAVPSEPFTAGWAPVVGAVLRFFAMLGSGSWASASERERSHSTFASRHRT